MNGLQDLYKKIVARVRDEGFYPDPPIVNSAATEPIINIGGDKFYLFASNNYFGMSSNLLVVQSMVKAAKKYGLGSGGPRLFAGTTDLQVKLEILISDFLDRESTITFTTGYMANIGMIPALLNPMVLTSVQDKLILQREKNVVIFSDEFNHGSIADGIKLTKCKKYIYRHLDVNDLEAKLKSELSEQNKVIITDGVFSMEGDIAPLRDIVTLAKSYNCLVFVDDAHGIGVLGNNGRGTLEHYGIDNDDVCVVLGTMTKAFGGIGGFVTGNNSVIDYLRIAARTYILSAPIPPSIVAGLIIAIGLVKDGHYLRKKAFENAKYFKSYVSELGYQTTNTESLIVPIILGEEKKALRFSQELFNRKVYAPVARFPAVPLGKSRMRFVITSQHEKYHIDYLLEQLSVLKKIK